MLVLEYIATDLLKSGGKQVVIRAILCHSLKYIHPCMFLLFIYLACFAEWIMIRQSQSSALATRSWARGCVTFPLIRSVYFHLQKKEGKFLFIFLYFPVLFTELPVLFFPDSLGLPLIWKIEMIIINSIHLFVALAL